MSKKRNGKPHVRWPLNAIPNFQRNGGSVVVSPVGKGQPVVSVTPTKPIPASTYKAPPPKPKLSDFIIPPPPPRIPEVFATQRMHETIKYLVSNCPTEIGWVGAVEQVNQWKYILHDARVMDQEATGATFEYDDWNEAVTEMIVKKTMGPGMVDANLGHSHVNMGVSPSGTDGEQMMDLAHLDKDGNPTAKFSIQTIHNKQGSVYCAIYDWEHKRHYTNITIKVMSSLTAEDIADLDEQLKRVKPKTYSYNAGHYGTYGMHGNAQGGVQGGIMYGSYNDRIAAANALADKIDNGTEQQEMFDKPVADSRDVIEVKDADYITDMEIWDDQAWDEWEKGFQIDRIQYTFSKRWEEAGKKMADEMVKGSVK